LLKRVPDINRLVMRLLKGNSTLEDCVRIFHFVERLPQISQLFQDYSGVHKDLVTQALSQPIMRLEEEFKKFRDMIELAVDLESAENHEYLIRPQFDDALQEISDEKEEVTAAITTHFNQVCAMPVGG
jgi:DNA mismatch repair protein MSH2